MFCLQVSLSFPATTGRMLYLNLNQNGITQGKSSHNISQHLLLLSVKSWLMNESILNEPHDGFE